jgi:hypothetical protein
MPAVYPPDIVPTSHRGHYPHMAKHDAYIWERFLDAHSGEFLGFAYDVALGGVRLTAPDIPPTELLGWQYNTALKIDACGLRPDGVWIIEVKPDATVSALGAAIAYTLVARRDQVFEGELTPVIVCSACQLDVKWAAQQLGVRVFEVGA